jgi:hypothetical protein
MKWISFVAFFLLLVSAAAQKTPISATYKEDILRARLVAVVASSQSEPVGDLQENQRTRLDVENAITKWGRYQITQDTNVADLIIVVRKGRTRGATIDDTRIGNPGVILYPTDTGATISVGHGQTQPRSRTYPPHEAQPRVGTEAGSTDDLLEVYLGRTPRIDDASRDATQYPLDEPPIWFYTATDALKPPRVEAVTKFREAVDAAAKKKP